MRVAIIFVVLCFSTYGHCQDSANAADDVPIEIVDKPEDDVLVAHLTDDNMVEIDDMLMTKEQFEELFPLADEEFANRVAIAGKRWPNGVVPYTFASDLLVDKTAIRAAMNEWEKHTCVRFVPKRSADKSYVVIRGAQNKCSSNLGCSGGEQYINLGKNCNSKRVLMHELGHTLGLLHEQQHPDRDQHVKILWNNIIQDHKFNFDLKPANTVNTYGIKYDPTSIMHYSSTSFSKCSGCKTIQPNDPALLNIMGKSQQLSTKSDIPIVKKMYCTK